MQSLHVFPPQAELHGLDPLVLYYAANVVQGCTLLITSGIPFSTRRLV
jgi:hypothetical protein